MRLTNTQIRNVKAGAQPTKLSDQTEDSTSPRAIRTRSAIQSLTSDSSRPTARGPIRTNVNDCRAILVLRNP